MEKKEKVQNEEKLKKMEELLRKKEEEYNKLRKDYLYLRADFENYRNRAEEEKLQYYEKGKLSLLSKLIEIMDAIHSARAMSEKLNDPQKIKEGIELIGKKFSDVFNDSGIKEIKTIGETFDPNLHEAVGFVENDSQEEGKIVQEVQKGYLYNEFILRPAKVKIIKKKEVEKQKNG